MQHPPQQLWCVSHVCPLLKSNSSFQGFAAHFFSFVNPFLSFSHIYFCWSSNLMTLLWSTGIAPPIRCHSSTKPRPGFWRRIIPDQLHLCSCALFGVAVRIPGLAADQRLHTPIPVGLPEIDVGPTFVVLPVSPTNIVYCRCASHWKLPICHALCFAFTHEGYAARSVAFVCGNSTLTNSVPSFHRFFLTVQHVLYPFKKITFIVRRGCNFEKM